MRFSHCSGYFLPCFFTWTTLSISSKKTALSSSPSHVWFCLSFVPTAFPSHFSKLIRFKISCLYLPPPWDVHILDLDKNRKIQENLINKWMYLWTEQLEMKEEERMHRWGGYFFFTERTFCSQFLVKMLFLNTATYYPWNRWYSVLHIYLSANFGEKEGRTGHISFSSNNHATVTL